MEKCTSSIVVNMVVFYIKVYLKNYNVYITVMEKEKITTCHTKVQWAMSIYNENSIITVHMETIFSFNLNVYINCHPRY